jgi:hypothetical protein
MLDTVKFIINDIGDGMDGVPGKNGVHRPLVEYLNYINSTRLEQSRFSVDSKSEVRVNKTFLNRDMLFFSATNKVIERSSVLTKHLPSSNYKIRYNIDYANDNFSVEFSFPKYFFGSNVLQTTFNPNDKDFDPFNKDKNTLEYQYSLIYERFRAYTKAFFRNEFPGLTIDYDKIDLKRLDICYNLVFPDMQKAMLYLDAQKNIKKKRQQDGTTAVTNYETSIFIRNADYSFKIYHKGTEYGKHDRREHEKKNESILKSNALKPLGKLAPYGQDIPKTDYGKVFPVEDIQALADRTLRFEMTFFSSYISKIFNQMIRTERHFRPVQDGVCVSASRRFNNFRKYFNRITSILQNRVNWDKYRYNQKQLPLNKAAFFSFTLTNRDPLMCCNYVAFMGILDKLKEPLSNKVGKGIKHNSYYDLLYSFAGLSEKNYQNDLKMLDTFYSRMSAYYSKHHRISLKLNNDDLSEFIDHYTSSDISHMHTINFTKDTMLEMSRRFLDTVYQFEVKELSDYDDFKNKLLSDHTLKFDKSKILSAYKFCTVGVSLDNQAKLFNWAESTLRRYKTRFKTLGIDRSFQANEVPNVEFSFSKYFESIAENKFYMNFNSIFK